MSVLFGGPYSTHAKRVAIWNKAAPIPGCDKAVWRCDDEGRIIRWSDFGDRFSRYGWTIQSEPGAGRLARVLGRLDARAVHLNETDTLDAQAVRRAA